MAESRFSQRKWLIGILGILAGIGLLGWLSFGAFERWVAREPGWPLAACQTNLRQIGVALLMYAEESGGHLPPETADHGQDEWIAAVRPFYGPHLDKHLFCPADHLRKGRTSYTVPQSARGLDVAHLPHPDKTVLVTEKRAFHAGRRWAYFADGHISLLPARREPKRP